MKRINHRMIQLARESRGYTQTRLAEETDILQGYLSRIERGDAKLSLNNLKKIANVLQYPESFFFQTNRIATSDTHYRKSIVIDQSTKLKAEALMNIYKFNVEEMLKSLNLSIRNIPIFPDLSATPEKNAIFLRNYWNIDKGAISDLSRIMEKNGIIIIQVDFETDRIDGRTIVTDTGHPIIFINKKAPGDRQRLTLAHELGHVVQHINSMSTFERDEEDEAYRFGMEFLMPLSECEHSLKDLTIEKLADLKRAWKISMQSILYRAQKSGLTNNNRCRYLWAQFSSKGWRKSEPMELPREKPTLLSRMVHKFINELDYSKKEIANMLNLTYKEFEERYFSEEIKMRIA